MQKANVERRRRMGFVKQFLEQNRSVERDKLIGQMMMNFGVSKRQAREEIEGVCQAFGYENEGDLIKVDNEKENASKSETPGRKG